MQKRMIAIVAVATLCSLLLSQFAFADTGASSMSSNAGKNSVQSSDEYLRNVQEGCFSRLRTVAVNNERSEVPYVKWSRLAGDDAYGTCQDIVQTTFTPGMCDTAILASINGYWDALVAAGLAGTCNAAILLTDSNSLSNSAAAEIVDLSISKVYVLGGASAVSNQVVGQVSSIACVTDVERIAGDTAIETAIDVFYEGDDTGSWGDTCIVSTVNGFQDAMSISPYCYAQNAPVFLTETDATLGSSTVAAIIEGGFERVIICGGYSAVSSSVESQLSSLQTIRVSGGDCYETSAAIAGFCLNEGMVINGTAVATGTSYYDGLCASQFCGVMHSPLLLVSENNRDDAVDFLSLHKTGFVGGVIIGGVAAISESVHADLEEAVA